MLFTLLVIEKLKAAGFDYKGEFLKDVVDHYVVGGRPVVVFWYLLIGKGRAQRVNEFSILAQVVEQMSQCRELTRAFRFVFR